MLNNANALAQPTVELQMFPFTDQATTGLDDSLETDTPVLRGTNGTLKASASLMAIKLCL
jgi:hypothetical protein